MDVVRYMQEKQEAKKNQDFKQIYSNNEIASDKDKVFKKRRNERIFLCSGED